MMRERNGWYVETLQRSRDEGESFGRGRISVQTGVRVGEILRSKESEKEFETREGLSTGPTQKGLPA